MENTPKDGSNQLYDVGNGWQKLLLHQIMKRPINSHTATSHRGTLRVVP